MTKLCQLITYLQQRFFTVQHLMSSAKKNRKFYICFYYFSVLRKRNIFLVIIVVVIKCHNNWLSMHFPLFLQVFHSLIASMCCGLVFIIQFRFVLFCFSSFSLHILRFTLKRKMNQTHGRATAINTYTQK